MHELLPRYLGGAIEIVDLSAEEVDLRRRLRVPESVRYSRCDVEHVDSLNLGASALTVCHIGPFPPAQQSPDALAPFLRSLRAGARTILLLGWPIPDLPYHRMLGPLVAGRCQVLEAVPVEGEASTRMHCALIVERVDRLAPLRSYLIDITADAAPVADGEVADDLRTVLRIANEYVLSDLVARPLRRRLIELENAETERASADRRAEVRSNDEAERAEAVKRVDELGQVEAERAAAVRRVDELSRRLAERDAQLRQLAGQLAELRSLVSFRVGHALTEGLAHPGRSIVVVPTYAARAWRVRRSRRPAPTEPSVPQGSAPERLSGADP